jgi:hypothetical protein
MMALAALTWMLPAAAMPSIDTALVHGYDDDALALIFGVSEVLPEGSETASPDCALSSSEDGPYTYTVDEDGNVDSLTTEDGTPVEFTSEGATGEGIAYGEEGVEECGLTSVPVEGPNGQVNHGQVVRAFVQAIKAMGIRGGGCVVRVIAQSGYGKGDQQVRASDGDTDEEETIVDDPQAVLDEDLTVELETALAACHGRFSEDPDGDDDTIDDDGDDDTIDDDAPGRSGEAHANQGNGNKNKDKNKNGQGNGNKDG